MQDLHHQQYGVIQGFWIPACNPRGFWHPFVPYYGRFYPFCLCPYDTSLPSSVNFAGPFCLCPCNERPAIWGLQHEGS